eukprot:2201720-Amphidinium_carterae.1
MRSVAQRAVGRRTRSPASLHGWDSRRGSKRVSRTSSVASIPSSAASVHQIVAARLDARTAATSVGSVSPPPSPSSSGARHIATSKNFVVGASAGPRSEADGEVHGVPDRDAASTSSRGSSSNEVHRSKARALDAMPSAHSLEEQKLQRKFRPGEALQSYDGSEVYYIGIISVLNVHVRKKDLQPARGLVRVTARERVMLSDPAQYRVRQAAFFRQVVGIADAGHVHDYIEDSTPSPTDSLPSTGSWGQRLGGRVGTVATVNNMQMTRMRSAEAAYPEISSSDSD